MGRQGVTWDVPEASDLVLCLVEQGLGPGRLSGGSENSDHCAPPAPGPAGGAAGRQGCVEN